MELMQTFLNAGIAALAVVLVNRYSKGQFAQFQRMFNEFKSDMQAQFDAFTEGTFGDFKDVTFAEFKAETRGRFERLEAELLALRSDLTRVALAVGAELREDSA